MNRILILFAHPLFEKSRVHKALVRAVPSDLSIRINDLYEEYPDFNINIQKEKELLVQHDIIILQHPFYWYGLPPLLKQWIDLVLEFGWAYGPGGEALKGKFMFNAISTGGREEVYARDGRNRFTIHQFLAPVDQTAYLCHMEYLPPFVIHGTHLLSDDQITTQARQYEEVLRMLSHIDFSLDHIKGIKYLNELTKK